MKADSFTQDASQLLPGWKREKGRGRRRDIEIKFRVSKDEEIRIDQLEQQRKRIKCQKCLFLSYLSILYWLMLLLSQFIYLYTVSLYMHSTLFHLYPSLPICSAASLAAQSLLLNNLVLLYVSLRPCIWLRLSILQHLLSEISLSPVRWCWEQPSLYPPFPSDPPCFALFLFLTYMHAFHWLFYSQTQTLPSFYLRLSLSMFPLCSLSISTSCIFSWSVYDRALPIQAVGVALLSICLSESACYSLHSMAQIFG